MLLYFSNSVFSLYLVAGGKTPDFQTRNFSQIMKEQLLKGEESEVRSKVNETDNNNIIESFQLRKKIIEKSKDGSLKVSNGEVKSAPKKRGRWDQTVDEALTPAKKKTLSVSTPNSAATPVWDGDVSSLTLVFKMFNPIICTDRKLRLIYGGMKLPGIRVAKHQEPHQDNLPECGMLHLELRHQVEKLQVMETKVLQEGIVGMKPQKQSEKHQVIIVAGQKPPELIAQAQI